MPDDDSYPAELYEPLEEAMRGSMLTQSEKTDVRLAVSKMLKRHGDEVMRLGRDDAAREEKGGTGLTVKQRKP